jgi:integrase
MAVFRRKYVNAEGKQVLSPHWTVEFTHLGVFHKENAGTTSKKAAQELEDQRRREIHDRIKTGKAPSISLGEAAARYFETVLKKPDAKKAKLDRDLVYLNQLKEQFGKDTLLSDLRKDKIATWRDGMVTEGGLKPSSANRLAGLLRAILNRARDQWHVDAPVWKLKQLKEAPDRIRYLDDANEGALLAALPDHVRDFVIFLMDSGCRKGEAETLCWNRLSWAKRDDWGHEQATVRLFATDTKSDRPRRVPLSKRSSAILLRLRENYYNNYLQVFMYERGGVTRRIGNIRKPFETALKRAKIKPCGGDDFHIHDCRHHFASRLVQRGVSLQRVQELLGHANITQTMKYAHLAPIAANELALLD